MGIMKKSIFIVLFLTIIMALSVKADVSVSEITDSEYMINQGYSQATAEDVFMVKNRAAGKPIEPLYEKPQNAFVKGWFRFWAYVDPGRDEHDRLHHDIKLTPSNSDL